MKEHCQKRYTLLTSFKSSFFFIVKFQLWKLEKNGLFIVQVSIHTAPKSANLYLSSPSFISSSALSFSILQTAPPAKSVTVQSIGSPSNIMSIARTLTKTLGGFLKILLTALSVGNNDLVIKFGVDIFTFQGRVTLLYTGRSYV